MGNTQRTYLQWKEDCNKRGWCPNDTEPFDIRRYVVENGGQLRRATKLFEPGVILGNKKILDAMVYGGSTQNLCYLMECQRCGNKQWHKASSLSSVSNTQHCVHCTEGNAKVLKPFVPRHPDPEHGTKFGELTFIRMDRIPCKSNPKRTERCALVQCSCGAKPHYVLFTNLFTGKTTRCNVCAKKKAQSTCQKNYWGYADICPDIKLRRRLLCRIAAAINRCRNPNDHNYYNYGGRGITVGFNSRREFLEYLVTLPNHDRADYDMDRIDNDKGYCRGNIRFASKSENAFNKRSIQDLQAELEVLKLRLSKYEPVRCL